MGGSLLSEVTSEIERLSQDSARTVSQAKLDRWINADDIHVLGATYALISNPNHAARVIPPLQLNEVSAFLQRYFSRCLREDPKSEWADSRYTAGWDIVRW